VNSHGAYIHGYLAFKLLLQALGYKPPRRLNGEAWVPSRERLHQLLEGREKRSSVRRETPKSSGSHRSLE
jgi:hypothetical protein